MRIRLSATGILLGLACWPLAAQGRAGSKLFTLSGTVVDGANQPLAGVALSLQGNGQDAAKDPAISDAQGRFAFSGLPAGDYHLWAEGSDFASVPYGESAEPDAASPIRVGGENGDKSVVFRIQPRGQIEGVIRDEFGDPMPGSPVFLMQPTWREGRGAVSVRAQTGTDDRGRYRFGNVAPGAYMVCAGDSGGRGMPAPVAGPVDFAARTQRYYSRTCSRTFQLSPGQRAQTDLNPSAVAMATVSGHIRTVPPQTGVSVSLQPQDTNQWFGQFPDAAFNSTQGSFTLRAVPPGRYLLQARTFARNNQSSLFAELPLEVGSSDIDDVDVDLGAQATVDVAVHGVEDARGLDATLRAAGGTPRGPSQSGDNDFQFQGVPPGSYHLILHTPHDSCVQSVRLGDTELRGDALSVAGSAAMHIEVALTRTCGKVRVRAVRDGQAIPGAKVVLLVSGTPDDPGDLKEELTDDEGGFTFSGLSPGHYLVWAWAVEGAGAMAGPASLAAVAPKATAVDVTAGDPVNVDVPLLSGENNGQ
ncbi:MAG TPA: carboxypeptidase-like regulatory domain-containing protein [Bryobacteraceae bacterium]|nr:carboxypeptidase-like regulatory domain-containing protein [Bryobacteraceae bacterium]